MITQEGKNDRDVAGPIGYFKVKIDDMTMGSWSNLKI